MTKMTLRDLKGLFPPAPLHFVSPDGLNADNGGSQKKHRHEHKSARGHSVGKLTPAQWKYARRKKAANQ
jgi:hypothetical protein